MQRIRVIDSHTAGEPTRLIIDGGPDLGSGPLEARVQRFRDEFDTYRSAVVNEPRGSDTVVGALLCAPHRADCSVGVIFFNNVGFLGMCGHGTIGLVASLAHAGRLAPGVLRIDTPVGAVDAQLHADGRIDVGNVPSYRKAKGVAVDVPGVGVVRGDVAWGGNWFFLVEAQDRRLALDNVESLTDFTWRVRQALNAQGFPEVDHVELFGPSPDAGADCRNFVLCPGKAYDRSPCGTGTSAKLACLAADGKLAEGEDWIQESVIGSSFSASFRWLDRSAGTIAPLDQRPRSCHRGEHAAARRLRSILLGNPMNEPLMRTMSGQITTRIRDKILAGEYSPGSPLLQDSIAAEFGVSKIPVREALVRLRAEGLIDIEAHRGFRVRPLLAAEVDEVFRLRLAIEPAAVSDGARLAKAKDHIAAREALRSLNDALAAKTHERHRQPEQRLSSGAHRAAPAAGHLRSPEPPAHAVAALRAHAPAAGGSRAPRDARTQCAL